MKKWIGLLALLMLALVCATALGETNTQVKHYLMLGEDGYAEHVTDDARTDTIVLVSLDTKYNRVILTSILRDSKINNPRGNETKINLLYKNHGFSGIISCLERELDIQIEGAILVNFENVKPVIDALGGVDIEIDQNEYLQHPAGQGSEHAGRPRSGAHDRPHRAGLHAHALDRLRRRLRPNRAAAQGRQPAF